MNLRLTCFRRTAKVGSIYKVASEWPTLSTRKSQAVCWHLYRWRAAVGSAAALDELAEALQITWEERW